MFVTTPEMGQWVPPGLVPAQTQYWKAVLMMDRAPLYLVTFRQEPDSPQTAQTMAVAWESSLRQMVEAAAIGSVLEVTCLIPARGESGGWSARRVSELWLPSAEEAGETGPLLFVFKDEEGVYDSFSLPVARVVSRHLLLRLSA